jgi:mitochondrial splicing suppressor protein 51
MSRHLCRRCLGNSVRPRVPLQTLRSTRYPLITAAVGKRASSTANSTSPSPVDPDFYELTGKSPSLKLGKDGKSNVSRIIIGQDNLFHPLSTSPVPSMRQRGLFMRAHAYCSHPSHNRTRVATGDFDPEARKPSAGGQPPLHVKFECQYCGIPVSCSEDHWAEDYEYHMNFCETLRQTNEDDHDMRSGRQFDEFQMPYQGIEEQMINFMNWDTLLYTREFEAVNAERSMRHVTKMLTWPMTIGSVLHDLSPYNLKRDGRMTPEGLRSFAGKSLPGPSL